MTSFLQSQSWMEFQKSLEREVFEVGDIKIIKRELPFGKNYLYIPYGPSSPMTDDELRMIKEVAKRENSIFIKAEPIHDDIAKQLVRLGFVKSFKNIQPNKTVILDLNQSEDELLGGFRHKTRYNIRVAERHRVVVEKIQNPNDKFQNFWELMKKTTARDQFSPHPKEYYEKLLKFCELYIAHKDNAPLAAAMISKYGDTAYYLHGASDHEHRDMMAPYMLHWQILLNLKRLNFKHYDLWGIDAKKWPGVTRFKLGWTGHATGSGGQVIEYPGAFDRVLSKSWHFIYKLVVSYRT